MNTDKPESKPEPCKTCAYEGYPNPNCEGSSCMKSGYSLWQPKAAEPEKSNCQKLVNADNEPHKWEQRFEETFPMVMREEVPPWEGDFSDDITDKLKAFILAEIERVHAGYAPLIGAIEMAFKEADFLPDGRLTRQARAVFEPIRKAEQNRRGEGGK